MSLIPPEIVEQIKQTADIQEVVSDFVQLKRKGHNLWAPCPFHDEKTASFSVSPSKGIYKCFGCGKAGDVVRFVMDVEKASYPEALRWLAKRYNIAIPEAEAPRSEEDKQRQHERDSLFILTDWAKEFFKRQLREENETAGRDLLEKEMKRLGLNTPFDQIAQVANLRTPEDLFAQIGSGEFTARQVIQKLLSQ